MHFMSAEKAARLACFTTRAIAGWELNNQQAILLALLGLILGVTTIMFFFFFRRRCHKKKTAFKETLPLCPQRSENRLYLTVRTRTRNNWCPRSQHRRTCGRPLTSRPLPRPA